MSIFFSVEPPAHVNGKAVPLAIYPLMTMLVMQSGRSNGNIKIKEKTDDNFVYIYI